MYKNIYKKYTIQDFLSAPYKLLKIYQKQKSFPDNFVFYKNDSSGEVLYIIHITALRMS